MSDEKKCLGQVISTGVRGMVWSLRKKKKRKERRSKIDAAVLDEHTYGGGKYFRAKNKWLKNRKDRQRHGHSHSGFHRSRLQLRATINGLIFCPFRMSTVGLLILLLYSCASILKVLVSKKFYFIFLLIYDEERN